MVWEDRGRVALAASEGPWGRGQCGLCGQEGRHGGIAVVPMLAFKCSWG